MYRIADKVWKERPELPTRLTKLVEIDFQELELIVQAADKDAFEKIVDDLAGGAFLVTRKAFSDSEVDYILDRGRALMKATESSFHKMIEGVGDFWRDITPEENHKYSVRAVKQSMYFFPWNKEQELYKIVRRPWRIMKMLAGVDPFLTENNTPKDGIIDRVQLVRYPSGSGYVEEHQDPVDYSRLFISGYLSEYGKDFQSGGFYVLDANDERVSLESKFRRGDVGVGCGYLRHGVETIGSQDDSERWWLGPYTPASDVGGKRVTWGKHLG